MEGERMALSLFWQAPQGLEDEWGLYEAHLRRKKRSDETIAMYREAWEDFWRWAIEVQQLHPRVGAITTKLVNAWTSYQQQRPGFSDATIAIRFRNVRPFFSWWANEEDEPNPFRKADNPKEVVPEVPVVDTDVVRELIADCRKDRRKLIGLRDEAIIRLFFDTGPRPGELNSMEVDSWDRANDCVAYDGKTGPRVVAIAAATTVVMGRYARLRSKLPIDHSMFWVSRKGYKPLTASGIAQMIARRCRNIGHGRLAPYVLRHTWAHQFRFQGGQEGDLVYAAGWRNNAMAQRYGRSAAGERSRQAQKKLALGDQL